MKVLEGITLSTTWVVISATIGILVLIASLLGIFNPLTYSQESSNWALQAVGQDIGNLLAVPTLLISIYFITKGSVKAFSIWLGTLFYLLYAYLYTPYTSTLIICFYSILPYLV